MIMIPAGVFFLALIFLLFSMLTTKSAHRKFKIAAFMIANEVAYTFVVFSTANMATATCI